MSEDKKDPTEPRKPNLKEIIAAEEQGFSQAYIFVWEPNPNRDIVRISLDDGTIRLFLKRDKFLKLMLSIMNINHPGTDYNYYRIKESCERYGGFYLYDRNLDEFRELQEKPNFEKITARQLFDESRKETPLRDSDRFIDFARHNQKQQNVKSDIQPRSTREKRVSTFFRNFSNRKKP